MALASGETNYMAPASARQMASDLALLPMWYAEAGSAVLAPSAYNADFLKTKSELLGMDVALLRIFLFEYFGGVQCVRRRAGSVLVKSSAFRKRERIELV